MKKIALSILAALILMLGTSQFSRADQLAFYISFNSGASWTPVVSCATSSCATLNYSSGGITIQILGASANLPGTPSQANTSTTDFNIQNTNSTATSFWLTETASTFTQPASSPLLLTAQESITSASPNGSYTMSTTGIFSNSFSTSTPNWSPICSTSTVSSSTAASGLNTNTVSCTSSGSFGLETLMKFSINAGQSLNGQTTVTASAVPEPGSMLLLGSGLMGLAGVIRRRMIKK